MFTGLLLAPFKTQFFRNRSPADATKSAFLSDDKVNEILDNNKLSGCCTNLGKVELNLGRDTAVLGLVNSVYEYLDKNNLREDNNKGFARVSGANGTEYDALIIFSRTRTPNDDINKTQTFGKEKYTEEFLTIFYKQDETPNQLDTDIYYFSFYSNPNRRFNLTNLTHALFHLPEWCGFDYVTRLSQLNKWENLLD